MRTITRAIIGFLAAVLAIGLVIFGVQNTGTVQIQFLSFSTEAISVSLLVIGAFILGAATMWLLGLYDAAQRSLRQRRDAKERASLNARNKELEQKIASLERELGAFRPAPPAGPRPAEKSAAK